MPSQHWSTRDIDRWMGRRWWQIGARWSAPIMALMALLLLAVYGGVSAVAAATGGQVSCRVLSPHPYILPSPTPPQVAP